jgi:secreted trypsin-like serine protease
MQKPIVSLIAMSLLSLAACDQIRMPGSVETVPVTETTDTVVADVVEEEVVDAEPEAVPAEETDLTEIVSVPAENNDPGIPVITDLAAINAALCGLPVRPVDDSLTIAELTGAQPADDDIVETATINGTAASLSNFPGLVKMEPREVLPGGAIASGHCGATRIAQNWFITAAHCLDDDYDEVLLITGQESLTNPFAKRVQAIGSICHAAYGGAGNSYVNDIALVRVGDDVLTELSDLPIAKYGETQNALVPFNHGEVRMAGWGLTGFRGQLSNTLLSANLTMTGTGPAAIGVESLNGAGPCVGDSGGPLFVDEADGASTVVGVLSVVEQNVETREFCAGEYGARYTNIQGYQRWITDVIAACDSGAGLCGF